MATPDTYPLKQVPCNVPYLPEATEAYHLGPLFVLKGFEEGRWHGSVSTPDRLPTWEEMKEVRRRLLPPDVFLCVLVPPEKYWMNIHNYCLHLWEIRDEVLLKQMIDSAPERPGNLVLP